MMIPIEAIIPKKLLKKGLSLPIYEGSIGRDSLTLTLRETRHLQPAFITRTLVMFLNMVASLDDESQTLLQRLINDAAHGRTCKLVDINGRSLLFFPDPSGDPADDVFLDIRSRPAKAKAASKPKAKAATKGTAGKP